MALALCDFLESECKAILGVLKTAFKEAPSFLWQNLTSWKNIVSALILRFYFDEVFSQDDIDSFFQFFHTLSHIYSSIYLFTFSTLFLDLCIVLDSWVIIHRVSRYYFPDVRLLSYPGLARGFWTAIIGMREFFLIGRDDEEKKAEKEQKKNPHLGAPRSLRLDKAPQDTPPPTPTEPGHSRSSSGATTSAVQGGEGGSGGHGGSSRRGKGKKGRRR